MNLKEIFTHTEWAYAYMPEDTPERARINDHLRAAYNGLLVLVEQEQTISIDMPTFKNATMSHRVTK